MFICDMNLVDGKTLNIFKIYDIMYKYLQFIKLNTSIHDRYLISHIFSIVIYALKKNT